MKPHRILKAFKGVQDGQHDVRHFVPGPEPVMLSKGLAAIVVKEGWAEPVATTAPVPPVSPHAESPGISDDSQEEKAIAAATENKMKKPVKGKK